MGAADRRPRRRQGARSIVTSSKLVSRYRGKIWAWDVVNEPIEPKDGIEGGYRNSSWFKLLGIDHVDLAFRLARAADPATPLGLNEYGVEYTTAVSKRRRHDILSFLRKLRDLNTPVDSSGCSRISTATRYSIARNLPRS